MYYEEGAFLDQDVKVKIRGTVNEQDYIRWEMTPASAGGEQQACISGGIQSPI